jgi:imidazoleglycerol phosphate dehydratase HisB
MYIADSRAIHHLGYSSLDLSERHASCPVDFLAGIFTIHHRNINQNQNAASELHCFTHFVSKLTAVTRIPVLSC